MRPEDRKTAQQVGVAAGVGAALGGLWWLLSGKSSASATPAVRSGTQAAVPPPPCGAASFVDSASADAAMCSTVFPLNLPARNTYVLDRVSRGEFYVEWLPITSKYNGHEATFWVSGDALKIDGVRVTVDAITQQMIADMIGAALLTPKLADLIFQQADIRLSPISQPDWPAAGTMATTPHMVTTSALLDRAIAAKVGSLDAAKGKIVSTVGKHWVVSNELARAGSTKAQNYGWHFLGTLGGVPNETNVSGLRDLTTGGLIKVIQGPWMKHGPTHTDYSQNIVLVAKKAMLDGVVKSVADILADPALAPLASHQGVILSPRQPGVPEATLIS